MADGDGLFIVDNREPEHSGFHYLREWCELAKSFDIATGYFEIGALLELDGHWQQLDKIRILMGDEVTHRTRKALLDAVRSRAEVKLDDSLETDKDDNPFLTGVDAIIAAIQSGQIECKVYNRDKFHAKTYITHGKTDVIGSFALVGSSNFTRPGLSQNVELNIQATSRGDVQDLQKWFEKHWDDAEDINDDILRVIQRHTELFTPFDVYSRALHEMFHGRDITAEEWELTESLMFERLDLYQKEAYWTLTQIARQHGGAMLCDGVGLGKTFVGLMLIERLILHENKRVLLLAPKGAREGVWNPHLARFLPHIGGDTSLAGYSNLLVFNHTDLSREGYEEHLERNAKLADVVIIDEAHHFRNQGQRGKRDDPDYRSRYWHLYDLLDDPARPKQLFMLTATPINNTLLDFKHQLDLFTGGNDNHFAGTLGVPSLAGRIKTMTKAINERTGATADLSDHRDEVEYVLTDDPLFNNLVVQRSRAYAKQSQLQETGSSAVFPTREDPKVAEYSIRKTYGALLTKLTDAFSRSEGKDPLFSLPIYYPLNYYLGNREDIDDYDFAAGRQKQVVQLIRTVFLKRFESSVFSFETTCDQLVRRLLAFLEVHCETDSEKSTLERWQRKHAEILDYSHDKQLAIWEPEDDDGTFQLAIWEPEDDVIPPEMIAKVEELELNRDDYNLPGMIMETFNDLDVAIGFLEETRQVTTDQDDKLKKLTTMLTSAEFADRKVLIFSEFADTVRYVANHLQNAGIDGVEFLDSASGKNRADVIKRFAPYYNGSSSPQLQADQKHPIRILVATDVLSEGLNLQDACRLINYDIHWNPVRLMQRIGRVDRRLDPEIEQAITTAHPDLADDRGTIRYWNFLPPEELAPLLSLFERVTSKTLAISETLGIEGKKLLSPKDHYQALKDFNADYEGSTSVIEDMRLEYQNLLTAHPEIEARLNGLPNSIFSGRQRPADGTTGVFFCYRLPAWDTEAEAFTLQAGPAHWYLYDLADNKILEEPREIVNHIRSTPDTSRVVTIAPETLLEARDKIRKHIKNTYLKRVDAPVDAPSPLLACWLELNDG